MVGLSALKQIWTPVVSGMEAAHVYGLKKLENGSKTRIIGMCPISNWHSPFLWRIYLASLLLGNRKCLPITVTMCCLVRNTENKFKICPCFGGIRGALLPQDKQMKPDLSFEALSAQMTAWLEMDACLKTTQRRVSMLSFWLCVKFYWGHMGGGGLLHDIADVSPFLFLPIISRQVKCVIHSFCHKCYKFSPPASGCSLKCTFTIASKRKRMCFFASKRLLRTDNCGSCRKLQPIFDCFCLGNFSCQAQKYMGEMSPVQSCGYFLYKPLKRK